MVTQEAVEGQEGSVLQERDGSTPAICLEPHAAKAGFIICPGDVNLTSVISTSPKLI